MEKTYDRAAEGLGNIVGLEHVNVQIADQEIATLFYVAGLGLTRDPYLMVGTNNMWINAGRSHPLYARPLVNRNPMQTNRNYAAGQDAFQWSMPA